MLAEATAGNSAFPETGGGEWPLAPLDRNAIPEPPAGQEWPKISIVTPSFNQGPYLEKTIRSVLLQGYPNLEYIVIDGGSTDQSVDVIKKYEPWIDFWASEKDRGQSHAINKGLTRASGELLGWLNSDDWYTEGALFKLAAAYLEDKSVGAVSGQGHIVDHAGNVSHTPKCVQIDKQSLLDWWSKGNDFMQPSCLFTKAAWLDCGPLDESLHYSMDIDLWLNIAERYRFRKIEDLLSLSLTHTDAKTTALRNAMFADLVVVLMRHGGEPQARKILDHFVGRLDQAEDVMFYAHKFPLVISLFKRLRRG
jgi:glycosyltransferase involved in cell wall biosynthesis